ncbi:hypothetical protein GGD61_007628 [Bradyrhizobium sp. SBR1B]|nr:hypothetical protein [Bradyrhizobium sp. SBR1B]
MTCCRADEVIATSLRIMEEIRWLRSIAKQETARCYRLRVGKLGWALSSADRGFGVGVIKPSQKAHLTKASNDFVVYLG